ncbi:FadR/GntR family transcriptional regulator [Virgibacillus sp. W0430]|uniref:FadR/GntR family transcriptional regulator n=1 Tax=Virgibacillus sp. W0430 TaxID=3391580 RepID=UPI003F486912
MLYKPVKTKKTYEKVADSLIDNIKMGNLKPGDKLESIEQLSKSFEVSRSAIREALSGMRAMGLIEVRQGEGTFVASFNPEKFNVPVAPALLMKQEDVKELLEVRKILEVGSARAAAINRTEADLLNIKEALLQMENTKLDGKLGENADYQFHLAIAQATHNRMLINLLNNVSEIMQEVIRESRKLILYTKGKNNLLQKEHLLIYEAIKSRQSELAQKHMLHHLNGVETVLSQYLKEQ